MMVGMTVELHAMALTASNSDIADAKLFSDHSCSIHCWSGSADTTVSESRQCLDRVSSAMMVLRTALSRSVTASIPLA